MTKKAETRIVIAGGGTAGWMAAAVLTKLTGCKVTLVESEAIGTVGVGEATIPQIRLFNQALGIDESEFLRETRATFKLGIAFDGWLREGHEYMHAFGPVGRAHGALPFHHYWLRAKAAGFARPLAHYSLNELAARELRMDRQAMPYAYHLDAGLYAAFLRRIAETLGAVRVEGRIGAVEQHGETDDIVALALEDGQRISGDFFIDCTGFRALLIEGALKVGFEDWTSHLPCDRAMAVPCATKGQFTPYTKATARKAGWQWRIPLQHRIGNGLVYSSAHLSDQEASETLLANLDGPAQADPRPIRFTTGKRRMHWSGNCLAVGLSAGFMEPLESTSIHLIQSALSRFISVLPRGRAAPAVVDWFNAQADFEWQRIRDFLVLHYHANEREGEPFWDDVRAMPVPDTLAAKLEQWRASGFIHREHEELFTEVGWFQVLAGQGIAADGYNPIADTMDEDDLRAMLADVETRLSREAGAMPRHLDYLQDCVRGKPRVEVPA